MDWQAISALALVVGLVVGFFVARRKGRAAFQAAMSAAEARGEAAATATASQNVMVVAGNQGQAPEWGPHGTRYEDLVTALAEGRGGEAGALAAALAALDRRGFVTAADLNGAAANGAADDPSAVRGASGPAGVLGVVAGSDPDRWVDSRGRRIGATVDLGREDSDWQP